jgi:hypothetical protein
VCTLGLAVGLAQARLVEGLVGQVRKSICMQPYNDPSTQPPPTPIQTPDPPTPRASHFFFQAGVAEAARPWFFSWTFCVAACTIVSGSLAERTRLLVYPSFTVAVAALVHPILVHWMWSPDSWLGRVSECRPLDFAGGTVVHMIGGVFGIVGAAFVGPRLGRFGDGGVKEFPGHDMGWVTIGTLALWFGWYGELTGAGVRGCWWVGWGGVAPLIE